MHINNLDKAAGPSTGSLHTPVSRETSKAWPMKSVCPLVTVLIVKGGSLWSQIGITGMFTASQASPD